MGEVVPAHTWPTLLPHPLALCCNYPVSKRHSASIVATSTVRIHLSWLKRPCITQTLYTHFVSSVIGRGDIYLFKKYKCHITNVIPPKSFDINIYPCKFTGCFVKLHFTKQPVDQHRLTYTIYMDKAHHWALYHMWFQNKSELYIFIYIYSIRDDIDHNINKYIQILHLLRRKCLLVCLHL